MEAVFSEQDESPIRDAEKFHKAHLIYRNLQYQAMYGDKAFDFTTQLQEQLKPFDFKITFVPMSLWELAFLELIVKDSAFQEKIDVLTHGSLAGKPDLSSLFTEETQSECFKKVAESCTTEGHSELKLLADNHILQCYPKIDDSTTYEESIKIMAKTITDMMEGKLRAKELRIEKLRRHYEAEISERTYPHFIIRTHELLENFKNIKNPLLTIIDSEKKAFDRNRLLLLRATPFLMRKLSNKISETEYHFLSNIFSSNIDVLKLQDSPYKFSNLKPTQEYSFSYARSFLSGLASEIDLGASVMFYCSNHDCMVYGIEVPLPLSPEAQELFWITPIFGVADQIRSGEIAHPRSKTSRSTQGKPRGISGPIRNNKDHILELLKSSYTHPELTKRYHAFVGNNMALYIPPHDSTNSENITLDSLRQSNLDFSNTGYTSHQDTA
jgi:hypothetical protein